MRIILLTAGFANCLNLGQDSPYRDNKSKNSELFRALRTSEGNNANLTKTTFDSIEHNLRNYLNTLVDDKTMMEEQLYNINLASQLAVNVSKSQPLQEGTSRKDLILDELYAALKTRCSSGNKLLITDFARRRAQNEKSGLDDLVVQNAHCKVSLSQPLKLISLIEDVIVAAADEPAQTGQLKDSMLAIFQDGLVVNSWPVAAIELPIEPSLTLPPCFSFQYLGGLVTTCASTSIARDQWIMALTFNIICLKDGIGRGFANPVDSIASAADLSGKGAPAESAAPIGTPSASSPLNGVDSSASGRAGADKGQKVPFAPASRSASPTLAGAYNIFIGITRENGSIISAKDRESLEFALMAEK